MLKHLWIDSLPEPWQTGEEREWAEEMTAPFGTRYPGMAPAMAAALKPAALETALHGFPVSRVALVPASRPADVLSGARLDPGQLGHDQAWLLVERPPPIWMPRCQ
jgi:hypothetical protein